MIKRMLAIMLAMLTLTSLASCGGTPAVSETTEPATEPVTTEPVTEAPPPPEVVIYLDGESGNDVVGGLEGCDHCFLIGLIDSRYFW